MSLSADFLEEVDLLCLFNLNTTQEGIKVHHEAEPAKIAATLRLYEKGLITQRDGGYLTSIGVVAAEHAQALLTLLKK
jgi:uncharacterized protein (TIGR02647 family)